MSSPQTYRDLLQTPPPQIKSQVCTIVGIIYKKKLANKLPFYQWRQTGLRITSADGAGCNDVENFGK